jgi:numb-like protein
MCLLPPPFFFGLSYKTGKKAVKAVLWVSADGLRVVDEKTKVRFL